MRIVTIVTAVCLILFALKPLEAAEHIVTNGADAGTGTLRNILEQAADGDTIRYAPSVSGTTLAAPVEITGKNEGIIGNETPTTFFTAPNGVVFHQLGGVFYGVDGGGNGLNLKNLVIENIANSTDGIFHGAGIIGLHSDGNHDVDMGTIDKVRFTGNVVTVNNVAPGKDGLFGAGIIGVMSEEGRASLGNVNDVDFQYNRLTLTDDTHDERGRVWGAGLIGAASFDEVATVGNVNGRFQENSVHLATYLNGGGLIGVFSANNHSYLGNVRGDFIDNTVYSADNNSGGGIIGAWSGFSDVTSVFVGDVEGTFRGNRVTGEASYLRGGGIVGLRTYKGTASLGTVRGDFIDNAIVVGSHLSGGGIVGLYTGNTLPLQYGGNRDLDQSVTFAGIDGSRFLGNRVTVGGAGLDSVYALGGVVGVSGLDAEMLVADTIFQDNVLSVEAKTVHGLSGGAVYVGTDRLSNNNGTHVLTLAASAGRATAFRDNIVSVTENGNVAVRFNSITFGREWDGEAGKMLDSKGDGVLNIRPLAAGRVVLYDPIAVDMNNGKRFDMYIDGTGGRFLWGGRNVTDAAGGASIVFRNESATTLFGDYTLTTNRLAAGETNPLIVSVDSGATITFDPTREAETAMFDFTNASNAGENGAFNVDPGATLGVDTERRLLSIQAEYLVADGAGTNDVAVGAANFVAGNAVVEFHVRDGNQLWVAVDYDSPYETSIRSNANTWSAREALSELVSIRDVNGDDCVSDTRFSAITENLLAVTPEYAMSRMVAARRSVVSFSDMATNQYFRHDNSPSMSCAPCVSVRGKNSNYRLWGGYVGNFERMDGHGRRLGYDNDMHGILVGADRAVGRSLRLGMYGGFMNETMRMRDIDSGVDSDGYQVGWLLRKNFQNGISAVGDVGYAHFENDGYRTLSPYRVSGEFDQDLLSTGLGFEYEVVRGKNRITPFFRMRYVYAGQAGLAENGSSATETTLDAFDGNGFTTNLGAEFSRRMIHRGYEFVPRISLGWVHEYGDVGFESVAAYGSVPAKNFVMRSVEDDRDRFECALDGRFSFATKNGRLWNVIAAYGLTASQYVASHTVGAGVGLRF